jgi:hypothetical protein
MSTMLRKRQTPGRDEAKAQRVLLRHKTVAAALRHIAYSEGFELTDALIEDAERALSQQELPASAAATVHQMKRALFDAESVMSLAG